MKGNERAAKGEDEIVSTNGAETAQHADATIDQVRDLLFGGAQRSIETNLTDLRKEMQASVAALETKLMTELASVQEKLLQLEHATEEKRLASQRDIGAAISKLGESITGLGADRAGK